MPKKKEVTGFPCLVITFEGAETLNDVQKYVRFVGGVGVLDKVGLSAERPDWFATKTEEEIGKLVLEYKRYWKDKSAKVDVVDEETAAKVRADLEAPPKAETLADMKEKAEAEVDKRADAGDSDKPVDPDKSDGDEAGDNEPLPHQK